ncbi:pilus assembly protein N-terminal domain-containing protein [uncultured Cohaesibacter sp.]|uniref:pilus assembly protein N-terminal domain-containing protein n=1 Tax=uncultured Cohaesibacter sp. TaxID=1002546 RepID=UPI00292D8C60|nr:pilus assembly protein N-terminal domain-containing protein [uncultured Cohaesibacter sp.]
MKFVSTLSGLLIVGCLLAPSAKAEQSYPVIDVKMDRAKVMRVSRPAAMIIIGNPSIADATIKDSQTLIITGKQYGTTNLIVLDAAGEPIADELLSVSAAKDNNVTVYKGLARSTLHCSPDCEPVYRLGDDKSTLEALAGGIQFYSKVSKGEEVSPEPN